MTQNLVPNPGFELYGQCPARFGELEKADNWYSGNTGTPEYYRLDCKYAQGKPHNGQGFAGLILFGDYEKAVEYIAVELDSALIANQLYCGGFALRAEESFMYIDRVGMLLSPEDERLGEWAPILSNPQVTSPDGHPMVPELGWHQIEQQFVAQGGERFITLGNFLPPEQHLIHLNEFASSFEPGWNSYYYIDDVFLYPLNAGETCQSVRRVVQEKEMVGKDSQQLSGERDTVEIRDTVWFDFDKHHLDLRAKETLDRLMEREEDTDISAIFLNGHTDTVGTPGYNLYLSERRLDAVGQYFITQGVREIIIKKVPYGETNPLIEKGTMPVQARNRRVQITLRYARKRK